MTGHQASEDGWAAHVHPSAPLLCTPDPREPLALLSISCLFSQYQIILGVHPPPFRPPAVRHLWPWLPLLSVSGRIRRSRPHVGLHSAAFGFTGAGTTSPIFHNTDNCLHNTVVLRNFQAFKSGFTCNLHEIPELFMSG